MLDVGNWSDLVCLGALGTGVGLASCLFFKNKRFVINYCKGVGVGYAFYYNCASMFEKKNWIPYKCLLNILNRNISLDGVVERSYFLLFLLAVI